MSSAGAQGSVALRAIGLMAEWRRLAAAHLALGGGMSCACGLAFDGIAVADLERDLIDYLHEKHQASDVARGLFDKAGCGPDAGSDLASLLRVLAETRSGEEQEADALLQGLERAIRGLAESRR